MEPFRILTTSNVVHKSRINILTSSTPLSSLIHCILAALQSENIMQILFCFLPFHSTCVSFDYSPSHTLHLHPQLHSPEASRSPFTPLSYRLPFSASPFPLSILPNAVQLIISNGFLPATINQSARTLSVRMSSSEL